MKKLVLFDLDGTLVDAGGCGRRALESAMKKMYGQRAYEPFEDSDPENMPEPWRSERLKQEGDQ